MIAPMSSVMNSVLILPLQSSSATALAHSVTEAGYAARFAAAGEAPLDALQRTGALAVLLETELTVPSAFIPSARRSGASVIYFSASLSAYELVTSARRRGISHFPLGGSPATLRAMLDETVAVRQGIADVPDVNPSAIGVARSAVARARALLARSHELIVRSAELRATQRVALATCHRSRDALRNSIMLSTTELREAGMPIDRVLALVHDTIVDNDAAGACAVPWDEARTWCEEAYQVA